MMWSNPIKRLNLHFCKTYQKKKIAFLYTFANWARVYIEDHTLSMLDFVDWLGS